MPRYFLQLCYNGTTFNGWQIQANTKNTIQHILQEKLSLIFSENISIVGCGRTDAGVSAKDYYSHFDCLLTDLHLPNANYMYKLNKILPKEIAIKNIYPVIQNASARFDATFRTYEYYVHTYKNPFIFQSSLFVYGQLNFELMNHAAEYLLSVEDFTSFSKANTQSKTNYCKVTFAKWIEIKNEEYVFKITSNRFLRNMVRALVGTLLEVGKGKISIQEFKKIIANQNRSEAGMSVNPEALFLTDISYPKTIFC
jgi:tRNA pseudouridine38-40 synthase